jgi:glycosyltransferase involved in cell wall biosynthesis
VPDIPFKITPPLRSLLIAGCFPHPGNPRLGVWAQSQAEALVTAGVELKVVSPTSFVPRFLGKLGVASWAANCPNTARIGTLEVSFPRWPFYYASLMRPVIRRHPGLAYSMAWPFVKASLFEQVRTHKPDVIFAHHTFEGGESARRLHEVTGIPYVIADWDFDEIIDCALFPARRRHYERILAKCSSVIATSERMKRDIENLFPRTRVVVGHYGRDPIPAEIRLAPRPPDRAGRTIILCACGFYERKGVPLLIDSFATIAAQYPEAELWIVGAGPQLHLIEQAASRVATPQIRLLGPLPHQEVLQEMVWADVFALTGWDEPFATVAVEALAAGLPLLCSNDGGICDLLRDGIHGITVPPKNGAAIADALSRLISQPMLREAMSEEASRLFAERLTKEAYVNGIIAELQRACGRNVNM